MDGTDPRPDESAGDCSTSNSFADHDVDRGVSLITRTHRRLADADRAFEPTEEFFDRLEEAFIRAYLGSVDEHGIPDHVAAAIDDAKVLTAAEFDDRPDADLRTDVVPTFYQYVAGFHCAYRDAPRSDRWRGPAG